MDRKSAYAAKLRDPRWQKLRLEILERDGWECQACMSKDKTLHVHHLCYELSLEPWEYNESYLLTLCEDCHKEAPRGLLLNPILDALSLDSIGASQMGDILLSLVINCLRDQMPEAWIIVRLQEWIKHLDASEGLTPSLPSAERSNEGLAVSSPTIW